MNFSELEFTTRKQAYKDLGISYLGGTAISSKYNGASCQKALRRGVRIVVVFEGFMPLLKFINKI